MLENVLTVFLIFLTVLTGLFILSFLLRLLAGVYNIITSWLAGRETIEEPVDEIDYFNGRYDVNAFRKRMENMKDEYGLYDIPVSPEKDDDTGVEIVSNSREVFIDSKVD